MSEKVQRYEVDNNTALMCPHPDGSYVHYEDHKKLEDENKILRDALENIASHHNAAQACVLTAIARKSLKGTK